MSKPAFTFAAATKRSLDSRDNASVKMVCLALVLALFTLACRIAAVW
jgi:hypothetical protein